MLSDTMTPDGYAVDKNGAWIINEIVQVKENVNEELDKLVNEVFSILSENKDDIDYSNMTNEEKIKADQYIEAVKQIIKREAKDYIKYKNGQNPDYPIYDLSDESLTITVNN